MNRLRYAYSLYLKQHAHNPVDWYPWGEEAFERAIKEDKPVLVSIGYAACHWCHVMERESFEDEKVAGVMNDHFICIKVDREEHPEVDHMFMDALQIMTGQGGWPLNIFVTPDKKPFYGGTYFPPQPLYKRASWMEVLEGIAHLWKEKRDEIEAQGVQLMRHLVQVSATIAHDMPLEDFNAGTAYEHIMRQADRGNGGFGSAPKFPGSMAIRYLLADDYHYNRKEGKEHAVFSLKKMLWSGMYDQVGGGFCRYATDNEWMVPHFEKMLYDNALLISVMADAYKISKDDIFRSAIIQTIDFCKRELSDGAGFMSALDADSEGTEGKYYVWSAQELDSLLSEEERALYSYYNITEEGNWEYSNIIHATGSIEQWAAEQGADRERIIELRKSFLQKLFRARESRIPPALDNKKQLSWNALMNMALSDAYAALGDATYKEDAELHMRWMLQQFIAEGQLLHVNYGDRKIQGNADDWSYLIRALCRLGEITGKEEWWVHANKILGTFEHAFDDETRTFYYFSTRNDDMIRIRKIEQYDNATPSSNSIMAGNLMLLGWVFDNPAFTERSMRMWKKMQSLSERYPLAYACWVKGLLHSGKMEMLQVIGSPAQNEYNRLLQLYLPDRLLLHKGEEYSELPVLADKEVQEGEVVIYECTENYCKSPVYGLSEWLKKKC